MRLAFGSRYVNFILTIEDSTKSDDDDPEFFDLTGGSFDPAPSLDDDAGEEDDEEQDQGFGFRRTVGHG